LAIVGLPAASYLIQAAATATNPTGFAVEVQCAIFVNRNPYSIAYTFVLNLAPGGSPGDKAVLPLLSAFGAGVDARWVDGPGVAELMCLNSPAQLWNPTITATRTGLITEIDQSSISN
jgi:hypothetical protein